MSVEIEIKLPLLNGAEVLEFLQTKGNFKYEKRQLDYYYNSPHRDFLKNPDNICEWLRLRVVGDKCEINYKDWLPHEEKIKSHCTEYETEIDSYEEFKQILHILNFKPMIKVDKVRKAWRVDDVEVSIDNVADLGYFIELEYKGNGVNDVESARTKLFDVLKSLNAKTGEVDLKGYPYLMLRKGGYLP